MRKTDTTIHSQGGLFSSPHLADVARLYTRHFRRTASDLSRLEPERAGHDPRPDQTMFHVKQSASLKAYFSRVISVKETLSLPLNARGENQGCVGAGWTSCCRYPYGSRWSAMRNLPPWRAKPKSHAPSGWRPPVPVEPDPDHLSLSS